MADSENRRPLTTQQLRALEEAKGSSEGKTQGKVKSGVTLRTSDGRTGKTQEKASENIDGKKKRRATKKQARRTVAGLLLATSLVVCAIPVQDTKAGVLNPEPSMHVKVVNYLDDTMNTYEQIDSSDAPETWRSTVPYVPTSAQIYTTGSSSSTTTFQFAFIAPKGESDKIAVILGANVNNLPGGTLTVPQKVDGYLKYASTSTSNGYCAVNKDGQYMFYKVEEEVQEDDGSGNLLFSVVDPDTSIKAPDPTRVASNYQSATYSISKNHCSTDSPSDCVQKMSDQGDGTYLYKCSYYEEEEVVVDETTDPVTKEWQWIAKTKDFTTRPVMKTVITYYPCFEDTYSTWKAIEDQNMGADLFYYDAPSPVDPTATSNFKQVLNDSSKGRINQVTVRYVGRQYLTPQPDGTWQVGGVIEETNKSSGVFANKGQITNLVIAADSIIGVGDYAFYGCSGLKSVTLENGLSVIGNGAFMDCANMTDVTMDINSNISAIGEKAFYNCQALKSIIIPVNVRALGSSIFENCQNLESVDINGLGEQNTLLETIGDNAFVNCKKLIELHFPSNYRQKDINGNNVDGYYSSYLSGCTGIQRIVMDNENFDLLEVSHPDPYDASCAIGTFLGTLSESFYFEGAATSKIHQTAKDHAASFKYMGEDKFEKVVFCDESPSHANTFIINSDHKIIDMTIDPNCKIIEIPSKIGSFDIDTIGANSFAYNCTIRKVVIPSSVKVIEENAFKGCHNLEDVVFLTDNNGYVGLTSIGTDAFATQKIINNSKTCSKCGNTLADEPILTFTGPVDYNSLPFSYAMDPNNKISNDFQTDHCYITFYSSWPTNLTVKYDHETGLNTLINYPKYSDLSNYAVKDYSPGQTGILFPSVTQEYVSEANTAVSTPEGSRTPAQNSIIFSATDIVLPAGIEAIAPGLFSGVDKDEVAVSGQNVNTDLKTIKMDTVRSIDAYAFEGCTALTGFYQSNSVDSSGYQIGDYAFKNCNALSTVEMGAAVDTMGLRPFRGCKNINSITFPDSTFFTTGDKIIFELDPSGSRSAIVECLESRTTPITAEETQTITSMYPEAFKQCEIGSVDLSTSGLTAVSPQAFAQTDNLYSVKLPEVCDDILDGAFWNSKIQYIEVLSKYCNPEPEAFANVKLGTSGNDNGEIIDKNSNKQFSSDRGEPIIEHAQSGHVNALITAYCADDSKMHNYAGKYYYFTTTSYVPTILHTVYFWDTYESTTNPTLIGTREVEDGHSAVPPEFPDHSGIVATGWTPNYMNIVRDTDVTTVYSDTLHEVWFTSTDLNTGETTILTEHQFIEDGKSATPPAENPTCEGYVFKGWKPDYRNIYHDGAIVAWFAAASDKDKHTVSFFNQDGSLYLKFEVADGGELTTIPTGPAVSGYTFKGWAPNDFTNITKDVSAVGIYEKIIPSPSPQPSGKPDPSASATATPTPSSANGNNATVKTYTCTVSGGSGTGSYIAGQVVPINAYDMGEGQVFDRWTTSTGGVAFGNATNPTTYFTMPANNVAITATFKTGSGKSSSGSGNTGNNGSGNNKGNTGTSSNPSGTSVQVTKGGISNTGVAGATVSGSTDNFIVKVTDDKTAADVALTALQNKFGDITQIKYLPMDISLYDSTGRTKIADTSGISVNLTLPLPDDLASYAGNNRIASVAGGVVEDLNSRFTTVDGVPCISFTANHFSPYVIYVDTANLTEKTIDYTPKTGDPIHPKWFLAIGMACVAVILFFKKDKVVPKKAKA